MFASLNNKMYSAITNIYIGPIHKIKGRNGFGLYPVLVVKFKKVNKKGILTIKL